MNALLLNHVAVTVGTFTKPHVYDTAQNKDTREAAADREAL